MSRDDPALQPFRVQLVDFTATLAELRAVRDEVFVGEQRVPVELEHDALDPLCTHALARLLDGTPIGAARLTPERHIGRMAVRAPWRGRGVGDALLLALVDEARKRQPGPAGVYEAALALCAYQQGDYATAAMWIRKYPMTDNPQYHAIAAVIFAELGDPQVTTEVAWLRTHAPQYFKDARAEIAYRIGRKEDVDRILASLEKAGVPVSGP